MKLTRRMTRFGAAWRLTGAVAAGLMAAPALAAQPTQATENSPAIQALFDQAAYWHQRYHDELAREALQKVLMVDANNTQAVYLMALYALRGKNDAESDKWRQKLEQMSPGDPRLQELDGARKQRQLPQAQLTLARQQARSGNIAASLQTWGNLFNGEAPPLSVAPEYYLTMAGDRNLQPQAITQLRALAASHPNDPSVRLALGQALTYQESTRREGIKLLSSMASGSSEADSALRQALLWLQAGADDAELYQNWQQRHPQDAEVIAYYRKNIGGNAKGQGFNALNSGDAVNAQQSFEKVLQANPNDADALAGMGYALQRQGDYAKAADYLSRAAQQGGDDSAERQQQAADALFYGKLNDAQNAAKAGNSAQALALIAPLTQEPGERGIDALLFRADLLRRSNDPAQAEQSFRAVLQRDINNKAAKEGLYYVLRQQKRTAEADALLADLPEIRQSQNVSALSPADTLRNEAKRELAGGNAPRAISLLQQGAQRFPESGWIRLDLARLYRQQGNAAAAADAIQPLYRANANPEQLYAAALFSADNDAWQQVNTLLARIPERSRNASMRELAQRAGFNLQMSIAEGYVSAGKATAALNTLRALAANPPASPNDAGKLAKALADAGDLNTAVALVRANMSHGVQGGAGDYAAQVAVLNQAGLSGEAQAWLDNPQLLARTTPSQLKNMQTGNVIQQADQLRKKEQYAAAYDLLVPALQRDPNNTDLLFAMARLYQSGKMNKEAGQVYDYLLTRDTPSQDARVGAINVALALNDTAKAKSLMGGLRGEQTPDRLMMQARLAQAEGDSEQALSYLRSARAKLTGVAVAAPGSAPTIGGLVVADNPFSNKAAPTAAAANRSVYGAVMPWQQATAFAANGSSGVGAAAPASTQQQMELQQVDAMMDAMNQDIGTWAQGGVEFRSRDGETGLSRLTEVKAPLTWSDSLSDDVRLEFNATPVTLSSGNATGNAYGRLGTGAVQQAVQNMVQSITDEYAAYEKGNSTLLENYLSTYSSYLKGDLTYSELNPFTSSGYSNLGSLLSASSLMTTLKSSDYQTAYSDASKANVSDSQRASGMELNMAVKGKNYKLDVGSTPLGQNLKTLVGGAQWSPKLSEFVTLMLTGERRAVTDSLLSYVGLKDKDTGEVWGQVTKNGGGVSLSYDNGDMGAYAGASAYSYLGTNVASNSSVSANAGAYVRPIHEKDEELKAGINLGYTNFAKNLSYYSLGQGGYFSPQDYLSISFPVEWMQKYDKLTLKVGGAVGYQSYSQDRSAYYPTNSKWQSLLETMADYGYITTAYYSGGSKSGIGYNAHVGADYKVNKALTLGGQFGYDTFGSYNETQAQLNLRYMLGDK